PSNSVKSHHSSKYAASERPGYAASEHGPITPSAEGGGELREWKDESGPADYRPGGRVLVRGFVLRDDVAGDATALIDLVPVRPCPLTDSRALLAARPVTLATPPGLRVAGFAAVIH